TSTPVEGVVVCVETRGLGPAGHPEEAEPCERDGESCAQRDHRLAAVRPLQGLADFLALLVWAHRGTAVVQTAPLLGERYGRGEEVDREGQERDPGEDGPLRAIGQGRKGSRAARGI